MRHTIALVLGYMIVGPVSLVLHLCMMALSLWTALTGWICGRDGWGKKDIPILWSGHIGPCYLSSRWMKHWAYTGVEPETKVRHDGSPIPPQENIYSVEGDLTFAFRMARLLDRPMAYNVRGDETFPVTPTPE